MQDLKSQSYGGSESIHIETMKDPESCQFLCSISNKTYLSIQIQITINILHVPSCKIITIATPHPLLPCQGCHCPCDGAWCHASSSSCRRRRPYLEQERVPRLYVVKTIFDRGQLTGNIKSKLHFTLREDVSARVKLHKYQERVTAQMH